jgi:hypothetical protein
MEVLREADLWPRCAKNALASTISFGASHHVVFASANICGVKKHNLLLIFPCQTLNVKSLTSVGFTTASLNHPRGIDLIAPLLSKMGEANTLPIDKLERR